MDDYFKQLKEKLKSIKKELKTLLETYDSELEFCKLLSERMSAMRTASIYGVGTANFDKEGLKKVLPAYGECSKYPNEIKELVITLKKCGIKIDDPNITIRTSRPCIGGVAVSTIDNEDAVNILSNRNYTNNTENIGDLFEGFLIGNVENVYRLSKIYNDFYNYVWAMDYYMTNIDALIQAIDNEKIKSPIKDITVLYSTMIMLKIPSQDITKILGKAIAYNANYLKKHPNADIKHIELIKELATYYNEDGTIKAKINISTFKRLLNTLKDNSLNYFNMVTYLINLIRLITKDKNKFGNNYLTSYLDCDKINEDIINQLEMDIEANLNSPKIVVPTSIIPTTNPVDRTFLNTLKEYYKNGEIIAIPKDIELFYQQLSNSSLDKSEKKLIKKLMSEAITIRKKQIKLSYLTPEEKKIYEKAIELADNLSNDNPDLYTLKQYLSDLDEIFEILDNNPLDKEEWIQEIHDILIKMSLICSSYMLKQPNSTNSLVFLLNKNDIPYIYEDYEGLDSTYQKAISSLITRINPQNTSNFKLVKNTSKEEYQMYEYNSPIAHIFFIEITKGIYMIIGADKAYSSYEEMTNRLRSNITKIKEMESIIKKDSNRILKNHENYLRLFTTSKRINKKKVKKEPYE